MNLETSTVSERYQILKDTVDNLRRVLPLYFKREIVYKDFRDGMPSIEVYDIFTEKYLFDLTVYRGEVRIYQGDKCCDLVVLDDMRGVVEYLVSISYKIGKLL